jgi:hypothetical protein
MLKIFIGFVIFAALAIYVIMKGGDSLDMGGESMATTPCMPPLKPLELPQLHRPRRPLPPSIRLLGPTPPLRRCAYGCLDSPAPQG